MNFGHIPESEQLQLAQFLFDQLIDGFAFFSVHRPIDWKKIPHTENKIQKLASNFRISDLNQALADQQECEPERITSLTFKTFFGKRFFQYAENWEQLIQSGQIFGEFHMTRVNGEDLWVEAQYRLLKNPEGKTTGILCIQHDITRQKQIEEDITRRKAAESLLIESEEKFRSLVSNIPGVIYRCKADANWTILYITDAIKSLTGYTPEELMKNRSIRFADLFYPDDLQKAVESMQSGIRDGKQFNIEYRIVARDKSIRWVSNIGRPVVAPDKTVKWLEGFLFDITDRIHTLDELKQAMSAAEEASKAKSEFLANISHEIRTPLNSVLGFTELLEGFENEPTQLKYLNSIKASGRNLMLLINDLLDLSKIEAGRMTLHYTNFDIRPMLNEIRNVFSLRVAIKGIGYHESLSRNFPAEIRFDETRLRQIIINLVGNAVKFTHQGSVRIRINAYPIKNRSSENRMKMVIRVLDTGIGIPEEAFRMIFESFRQHSQLDSRKYGGTGLGLAITKRLVEAMNGTISLESKVGKGTVFIITFPSVEYEEVHNDGILTHPLVSVKAHLSNDSTPEDEQAEREMMLRIGVSGRNPLNGPEYHDLISKFNQDLVVQWKSFETRQPLKEIKLFALDIINLGRNYNQNFILEYGEQLLSTIENFDIEEMRLKLDYFPDLLKLLKKLDHEN